MDYQIHQEMFSTEMEYISMEWGRKPFTKALEGESYMQLHNYNFLGCDSQITLSDKLLWSARVQTLMISNVCLVVDIILS